ncbi:MAG TPA: glycosyltransferase, partial [Zoogloea sp.]|nr:glycosyltransferase [Zoogloea sp.]
GASIGTRPMFFGGFFFVIAGIQMVTTGVLAELLTRVYFESGQSQAYVAHETAALTDVQGWHSADAKTVS